MARVTAFDLSYQLSQLPNREEYLKAAAECLLKAVSGDVVGWNDLDLNAGTALLWLHPPESVPSHQAHQAVLAEVMADHPLVLHYLAHPADLQPRRISDCLSQRQWKSHRVYHELLAPMEAKHQIAVLVARIDASIVPRGRAWAINRSGPDFTEAEQELARGLQPMLAILDRVYASVEEAGPTQQGVMERVKITERELDVLASISQGLSAQQIANLRRISVRTVRKHLEHVYDKLGCHDRVMAINHARRIGLL